MSHTLVIIPAAGVGNRMGADRPKQYLQLDGRPMLSSTVARFEPLAPVDLIAVAVSPDDGFVNEIADFGPRVRVMRTGGATRAETVLNTLEALAGDFSDEDLVLVHDAARPLVEGDDVLRLMRAVREDAQTGTAAGAVLAMPVADTVKRVDGVGILTEDISRERLVRIATPQCFAFATLRNALRRHREVTDESSAVRAEGLPVRVVSCSAANFKVTVADDLDLARRLLNSSTRSNAMKLRIGCGYDSHRLVAGRPFILGGIEIAHTLGLDGHSDADALLHAVTDAILGAAGCGNIGLLFPDNDPAYKGADSAMLLERAWEKVRETGNWRIENIDSVIVAQKPKLNPHVPAMAARIAEILAIDPSQVSIKPKTNERLGFEGREEGVSVQAVVLLTQD